MEIGEKIWSSYYNEVVKIINVENEWTSFPHGSGTHYKIYTIKRKDGTVFKFNELENSNNIQYEFHSIKDIKNNIINKKEKILSLEKIIISDTEILKLLENES